MANSAPHRAQEVIEEDVKTILQALKSYRFNGLEVLVTGGAGFIGSWLCDVLVRLGARVTCLDNLSLGSLKNIEPLMQHEGFRFLRADISGWSSDEKFDVIIHGASIPSPEEYMKRPVESLLPNTLGLIGLLEKARRDGSTLLFTSTSEVYGDATIIPTPEEYWGHVNPLGPRSSYDEAKRCGEALCMAYHRQHGLDVRIARIFNTYGPRMDVQAQYARVIGRFIGQALKGAPLTIHGDGRQTRSFCYITDTIMGLLKMLAHENARGQAINIGSPRETRIIELAQLIRRLTNSSSPIIFAEPRPEDPRRRCPAIDRARSLLGWEPRVGLEEGLRRTIEWMRQDMKEAP